VGAAAEFTLTAGQVFAALFGIAAVAALWWAYFDVVAIVAERGASPLPPRADRLSGADPPQLQPAPRPGGDRAARPDPACTRRRRAGRLGLVALAAVATVLAILIAYEAVHFREARARVRANPSATLAQMRG
jgi:hypothetical protein